VFGNMCVLCDVLCESEPVVGSWFVSMQIFQVGGATVRASGGPALSMVVLLPLELFSLNILCSYLDSVQNV
jgi:hypothetical protein